MCRGGGGGGSGKYLKVRLSICPGVAGISQIY